MNPKWVLLMFTSSFIDYICGLVLVKYSGLPMDGKELPLLPKDQPRNRAQKAALAHLDALEPRHPRLLQVLRFRRSPTSTRRWAAFGFGEATFQALHIALPIGISFYTFQSMSYAIDVYRGDARPLRNPIDFACFVAVFPHQLAGPIIRYWSIADQFRARSLTYTKFARGAAFFCLGLSKKIILANSMAHVADTAFNAGSLQAAAAWYGVVGLRLPDLLRFLRLFRHGGRHGADARFPVHQEFQRSLPRRQHHRLLAAVAHRPVDLAARLPLSSAWAAIEAASSGPTST